MHSHSISFPSNMATDNTVNKKLKGTSLTHNNKKVNIKRWQNNEIKKKKSDSNSLLGFVITSVPLDFSRYRTKEGSQSSTSNTYEKEKIKPLSDSLVDIIPCDEENITLNQLTNDLKNLKVDVENITNNNNIIIDNNLTLKDGDYIYDNSIKIIKFLSEGAQARIYIGLIEEIDKLVAVKRYTMPSYDQLLAEKIILECEMLKSLEHDNIIKYFDVEFNYNESECNSIDIIMEFLDGINLKDFSLNYLNRDDNKDIDKIKLITRKLLEGLSYLHDNKIIHRDLKPENIIVTSDLEEIKILDFGICTKVKESETFRQRTLLGTPWYMSPEVILEKPYAYEADIWSLGCIIYELICGVKPYADMNPFNAMLKMAQYTSPLEYADEHIKDIFYDKKNRDLLDFLQKCWRPNNLFRPSAKELLEHKFLK